MAQEAPTTQEAIFAAGCFWCIEKDMEKVDGVKNVISGYTGGDIDNPTYEHHPGHIEAVKVLYNPEQVSYEKLLDVFWHNHDPFDSQGQFCDRGHSYTPAIFVLNDGQRQLAEQSKQQVTEKLGKEVITPVLAAKTFWKAEDYHQQYYEKNPIRYRFYRWNCGRDQRLEEIWKQAKN